MFDQEKTQAPPQEIPDWRLKQAMDQEHNPQPGGYFVVYKDGYKSFSPAKAFEEGYTRI